MGQPTDAEVLLVANQMVPEVFRNDDGPADKWSQQQWLNRACVAIIKLDRLRAR